MTVVTAVALALACPVCVPTRDPPGADREKQLQVLFLPVCVFDNLVCPFLIRVLFPLDS